MRARDYRRQEERLKDLRRRHLYRNRCINGRYEISDKEDKSITYKEVWKKEGINLVSYWGTIEIHPSKLDNHVGHWQESPSTKYSGAKGYYRRKKTLVERKLQNKFETELEETKYNDTDAI